MSVRIAGKPENGGYGRIFVREVTNHWEEKRNYPRRFDQFACLGKWGWQRPNQESVAVGGSFGSSKSKIFGFCFDKIQSDYSEHAESAPQDSVPQNSVPQETFQELPQAGSTYIIRSIKDGATVCGGQHDVQTVHRDKHANATPKYHWTVIDQDGWLFLKNVEHGYYLGYTRTGSTRLIEAKSQKLMSEQCQITMRFETGGGITLWGHMNNKMGKILLRDVQTRYTNFKDAFEFVQVR